MELDLTSEQFKKLDQKQKLDILYCNQIKTLNQLNEIGSIKNRQALILVNITAMWASIGWVFFNVWRGTNG